MEEESLASAPTSEGGWRDLLEPLRSVDRNAAIILVVATGCYVLSHFETSGDFYNGHLAHWLKFGRFQDMASDLYWLGSSNVLFGLVPLLALWLLREPFEAYGFGLGDRRVGLAIAGGLLAIMLPLTAIAAHTSAFAGQYPLDANASHSWGHFWIYETLYVGYFAGWELFHRGFLLFGLRRRIGNLAIFVQAMPFTLLHFGKPEPEAWGALVAGIALGILAVRARSFWYGVAVHGTVAFFMDLLQSWSHLHGHH